MKINICDPFEGILMVFLSNWYISSQELSKVMHWFFFGKHFYAMDFQTFFGLPWGLQQLIPLTSHFGSNLQFMGV